MSTATDRPVLRPAPSRSIVFWPTSDGVFGRGVHGVLLRRLAAFTRELTAFSNGATEYRECRGSSDHSYRNRPTFSWKNGLPPAHDSAGYLPLLKAQRV